jgi:hypothetical protein
MKTYIFYMLTIYVKYEHTHTSGCTFIFWILPKLYIDKYLSKENHEWIQALVNKDNS